MINFSKIITFCLVCTALLFSTTNLFAQYVITKNAKKVSNEEYILTANTNNSGGGIWHKDYIDLSANFNIVADLYFGTDDGGADGIAFVLQSNSTAEGSLGGGMGYYNIKNSLAIEFDTWQNAEYGDPTQDHFGFMREGDTKHTAASPAYPCNNLEDGQWHKATISWDAASNKLKLVFEGQTKEYTWADHPNTMYFGFTAATGGAKNEHKVKIESATFKHLADPVVPTKFKIHAYSINQNRGGTPDYYAGIKGTGGEQQMYILKRDELTNGATWSDIETVQAGTNMYAFKLSGTNMYITVNAAKLVVFKEFTGQIPDEAKFHARPPLTKAADAQSIYASFESVKYPTHYMRHQGFVMKITQSVVGTDSELFKQDASWKLEKL